MTSEEIAKQIIAEAPQWILDIVFGETKPQLFLVKPPVPSTEKPGGT